MNRSPSPWTSEPSRMTPREKYKSQRKQARRRGIAWHFNFDQWWEFWQRSGHWAERSTKTGNGFVMCRKGDVGPYSPDNVFIATCRENSSNQPQKKSNLPMGVKSRKDRPAAFTAYRRIKGKITHIGSFRTVEQAQEAYRRAWGEEAHT